MPNLSFRLLLGELRRRNMGNPEYEEVNKYEDEDGDGDGHGDGDGGGDADGNGDGDGDGEGHENVTLPEADLFVSMVYPPALYIIEGMIGRILEGLKYLVIHGAWETKNLPKPEKNVIDKKEVNKYEPSPALKSRIDKLVPQLTDDMTNLQHLKKEFNKHGPNILSLTTVPAYIEFALDVYEDYGFAELTDFVVTRIEEEGIGQPVQFYGMSWVSVRLGDLLRIVQSFPRIDQFKDAVGVQLFKDSDQYMFYEINMNFTKDQRPAMRCRKTPEVYVNGKRGDAKNLSRDLRVILMGNKVGKQGSRKGEVGECSTSKSSNCG